MILRLNLF